MSQNNADRGDFALSVKQNDVLYHIEIKVRENAKTLFLQNYFTVNYYFLLFIFKVYVFLKLFSNVLAVWTEENQNHDV